MGMAVIDETSPEWATAKYAYDLSFADIDESAQQYIAKMIFDVIIISVGAYNEKHDSGLINEDLILESNASNTGSVLWSGRGKIPANLAALCNGTWAEILDYQDVVVDPRNNGHLGVTIIPAAYAVAERENASGQELITAIAAGLEVAIAVLRSIGRRHRSDGRGFRTTSLAGPLGAAVACAKLLGLDVKEILYAMGIAGACSPNGLMPSLAPSNGSFGMDKDWVNGQAAQLAVNAADLAKRGMTASERVVTGEMGIVASHSHGDGQDLIAPKLGAPNISKISLKKYACCYGVHSSIDATKMLCVENQLPPDQLDKIIVRIKADSAKTLSTRTISNHMAARFSLPYAAALAVIKKDKISMHDFEEPAIFDQKIINLMEKVEIVADQELTEFHVQTGGFPAQVELLSGNEKYTQRVDYPVGSSQRPMSWDDLENKFAELTANHYSDEKRKSIFAAGKSIPAAQDINQFSKLF